jgi:hypothetical protein
MSISPLSLLQKVQTRTAQLLRTSPWIFRRFLNFSDHSAVLQCFGPEQNPDSDLPFGVVKIRLSGGPGNALVHGWIFVQGAPDAPCTFDLPAQPLPEDQLARICAKLASDLDVSSPAEAP